MKTPAPTSNEAERLAALQPILAPGALDEEQLEDVRRRAAVALAGKGACWWNPGGR